MIPPSGLPSEEAKRRLQSEGPNEISARHGRGVLFIAAGVLCEPMFLLLVGAGILYCILGDLQEALMLLGFVIVMMGITIYQEGKTEHALEALRDLSSPRALVMRDGTQIRIAARELVRGDIVLLREGDRVPADGVLLSCHDLLIDESLLTGESVPVRKAPCEGPVTPELAAIRPGGDDLAKVFAGTVVLQGQGVVEVTATGPHTEMGRIGIALETLKPEPTLVQTQSRSLVRAMALVGLGMCGLVVIVYGLTRGHWIDGLLAGITLAMAILPEEIPVVLTVFLALGAWRMGRRGVLTRRIPAVEALGSATTLCVDKTGTLTINRMRISLLYAEGRWLPVNLEDDPGPSTLADAAYEPFHRLIEYGILASEQDPFDPMEKAFVEVGDRYFRGSDHLHGDWELVYEYALSPELLAMSHVWRSRDRDSFVIAAKGAPEAIADLCHLDLAALQELTAAIERMAEEGLRVLGVAKALYQGAEWPGLQHDFDFEFLGLVGLADPPRPSVPAAMAECRQAGVRVVMITGDYPKTAQAIARRIGLEPNNEVITGHELASLPPTEIEQRVATCSIFARMVPEQKLSLVKAMKGRGDIVAMTGDGVNDAPALKAADVGIAMGQRGTDVAREAASLVVLDDDFASIVAAIRMGRRIYDNLKKAVAYVFAVHTPIIGLTVIPLLLRWPLVFSPVHVMFLELIIDPACSIAFEAEPEEEDVMRRPPRNPREPMFSPRLIGLSVLQGVVVLALLLVIYGVVLSLDRGAEEARALTFTTLVVANLALILTNRSWSRSIQATLKVRNAALWWVIGGAMLILGVILSVPALRSLFAFGPLHPIDILFCVGTGLVSIAWFEALKALRSRYTRI